MTTAYQPIRYPESRATTDRLSRPPQPDLPQSRGRYACPDAHGRPRRRWVLRSYVHHGEHRGHREYRRGGLRPPDALPQLSRLHLLCGCSCAVTGAATGSAISSVSRVLPQIGLHCSLLGYVGLLTGLAAGANRRTK